jgi:hypothetical protein
VLSAADVDRLVATFDRALHELGLDP